MAPVRDRAANAQRSQASAASRHWRLLAEVLPRAAAEAAEREVARGVIGLER
jgi:hypothetical protein